VLVRLVASGLSPHTADARRARGEELTGERSRYRVSACSRKVQLCASSRACEVPARRRADDEHDTSIERTA
jgi:hypothetical protein